MLASCGGLAYESKSWRQLIVSMSVIVRDVTYSRGGEGRARSVGKENSDDGGLHIDEVEKLAWTFW